MKTFKLIAVLLFIAGPCAAAKTQDIILMPEGTVEARTSPTGAWVPVSSGVKLKTGAEIRTGADTKAGVFFPDGSRFVLGNNSLFSVEDTSKKRAGFQLKLGRLKAVVAGYFSSRFEVRTPAAVCAVRGTEFDLEVGKDGNTEMNVTEGLVEVNDSKGQMAVVSSEERIRVGMDGMSRPETVSLTDDRAGQAARPMAVRQETAKERTRTMMEELRNRELKANEAQLGKDSIDAFGKRVRLEEYLLRPTDSEFKLLFLSRRAEAGTLDWGSLSEKFYAKIPDDISKVGEIIDGMYMSKTAPANWMTNFEVYLTNTVDSIKETIDFTAPVSINFKGYGDGVTDNFRYYPGSIDYKQTLSGPGVPGGERVQFQQIQDFNSTTANQFTWTQSVINSGGNLGVLEKVTLDPSSLADVTNQVTSVITDNAGLYYDLTDPTDLAAQQALTGYVPFNTINPVTTELFPSGPGKADYLVSTTYADGTTVSSRKLLVSNEGKIIDTTFNPDVPASDTFLKEGSFNLEMVVGSSMFGGRTIDVLLAPEILTQKKQATTTADSLILN
jgi:hypothetical protein